MQFVVVAVVVVVVVKLLSFVVTVFSILDNDKDWDSLRTSVLFH